MLIIDGSDFDRLAMALRESPKTLAKHLAEAFDEIGSHDTRLVRSEVEASLAIRNKGLPKTFKYNAASKAKIGGDPGKVFVDIYTKWAAGSIFQTGGTIEPRKAGGLTILTDKGRGSGGKRRWTEQQIRQMVKAGQLRIIRTPNELLIVQDKGGTTKKGLPRKGSRAEIIAIIRKQVNEKRHYDFYGVIQSQDAYHEAAITDAIAETCEEISDK